MDIEREEIMNIVTVGTKEWISSATYQKIFGEE